MSFKCSLVDLSHKTQNPKIHCIKFANNLKFSRIESYMSYLCCFNEFYIIKLQIRSQLQSKQVLQITKIPIITQFRVGVIYRLQCNLECLLGP